MQEARIKACISGFLAGVFDCFVPTIRNCETRYQCVFILCWAVSHDVKTSCQLDTEMLAGSLEILTCCLTPGSQKYWELDHPLPSLDSLQPPFAQLLFSVNLFASEREVVASLCNLFKVL